MPAALESIDWPGIKVAAIAIGVREAARRAAADLPPIEANRFVKRVLKRSEREGWIRQKDAASALPLTVSQAKPLSSSVVNGADVIAKTLADDNIQTKIGFSTAARKVAVKVAQQDASLDKDRAQAVRHWAGVASTVHGWSEEKGGDRRVMINIGILNE